jgi:hypothetical protein
VSAALEVGNALLKEDSSELVYDNETGGASPKEGAVAARTAKASLAYHRCKCRI